MIKYILPALIVLLIVVFWEKINYEKILKINNLQANIFDNKNYWTHQIRKDPNRGMRFVSCSELF
jgi:hypothetical protein